MSALHKSLDETIAAIREQHNLEMQVCKDRTLAAEVEATLLRDQLTKAILAKEDAIQVASRLIEQFGVAEEAMAKARKYALALPKEAETQVDHPEVKS